MNTLLRPAISLFIFLSIITGLVYPVMTTAITQIIFPHQANGSLVMKDGKIIGSELIGQPFTSPHYFWGRPSATTPAYNASASGGSNLSISNPNLLAQMADRQAALLAADPANKKPIPIDLLTASASGLDPDISLAAAYYQLPRVANARHRSEAEISALIEKLSHKQGLGFWGEPSINVLALNMALEEK